MTDTNKKMLETAQILDELIIDATLNLNKDWQKKNRALSALSEAHKSLHEVIDVLVNLATEEELEKA
jgi:dsDNA-binding SOS-regulon protein